MIKFCDNCLKDVECTYNEKITEIEIDNVKIKYLKKYYICSECNGDFLDDLYDYDTQVVNNELRKHYDIITTDEINEILTKYNIGKKPLSLVLGLGEVNIIRYLDGANPTREISDLLKGILNSPLLFELYLYGNKDKISETAYKKSLGKTKQLELVGNHSKLYNSSLYIISKLDEADPLSLQKILYFANGFSNLLLNRKIFNDIPKAWKYGPVYEDVYDCFSYYKGEKIDYSELLKDRDFNLSDEEKEYLDTIIKNFGCYSGPILREMSHLTDPWIIARKGLKDNEPSTRYIEEKDMNDYFKKVSKKYNINTFEDISKYSSKLFKEAKNNLFK